MHGQRRVAPERAQRVARPAIEQQRRVDAADQRVQVRERALGVGGQLVDQRRERWGRLELLGQRELDPQRDQPLLRTVVEIALDPPPLGVGRLRHARPRRAQVLQRRPQLGLEQGVATGGAGPRRRKATLPWPGEQLRATAHAPSLPVAGERVITLGG